jgi:thiosulfate/3-mercaptopyruvate sulfurtransferase
MRHKLFAASAVLLLAACAEAPQALLGPEAAVILASRQGDVTPPPALRPQLLVSTEWLEMHMDRPNVVVLHFGMNQNGYNAGHIPGARFVNLTPLQPTTNGIPVVLADPDTLRDAMQAAGVSTSSHVVVYGDQIFQGARGFFILDYLGHPRVSLLDGGIAAWVADGYPVSTVGASPARGSMAPPARTQRLVTADRLAERLHDPRLVLVDARPFNEYAGLAEPTLTPPRKGHIPGAHNMPWAQLVVSPALPRLKDPEALRALYAAAGARVQSPVVTYCFSGMLSSMSYFVARYLGYEAILYDGSMFEWSRREDLPIAACGTPWC